MSGASGGWSGPFRNAASLRAEAAAEIAAQRLQSECNSELNDLLAGYNDRPATAIRDKLDAIAAALAEQGIDVDKLLFGGSVAKHTYVDGLSDVDSLIYLNEHDDRSPKQVLRDFARFLRATLPQTQWTDISPGRMAVTVTYQDGTVVQLLPAAERGVHTVIPSPDGQSWKAVRPHKFTEKLTAVNDRMNKRVVPLVKLAKGLLNANLPDRDHLSGYHVEALAVDAFKRYKGPRDQPTMLRHLIGHIAQGVQRPTADITGQTVHIDAHLGQANSTQRQRISNAVAAVERRLGNASTAQQYRQIFE
jgi:hypothetical protein